jgi:hypothetical protein
MKDKAELKKEIVDLWVELGRDPAKIKLDKKSIEELEDGLEKLKAVKMGFNLLFKADGNHALAVHLLSTVFLGEKVQKE